MRSWRILTLALLLTAALCVTPAAFAGLTSTLSGGTYSCVTTVGQQYDDCNLGVVAVSYPYTYVADDDPLPKEPVAATSIFAAATAGTKVYDGTALAVVDLNASFPWKTLVVRVEVCNSSGYTVHVADSPTNNGFGGDAATTQHDAEAHNLDTTLYVWRSDIGTGSLQRCQFGGPGSVSGCIVQDWIVREDELSFDSSNFSSNPLDRCLSPDLFDFPPYDEADSEDPNGVHADKLYVGLNRTYGSKARDGEGVQRACFFLSTETNPSFVTIGAECGF